MKLIPCQVVDAYLDLMETSRGAVNVKIVTAEPLSKKSLSTVQSAVLSMVGTGKKVLCQRKF